MAEYFIGGQRVDIDTSDNPSSAEIQKRIEAELARLTPEPAPAETQQPAQPVQEAVQQPVQEEAGMLDTVMSNVAEIPEGVASGATKTIANISNLADRFTGGALSSASDWMNENILDLGYIHIGKDGAISWTDDKIDTAEPDAGDNAVEIFNTETITGDVTEGISQFVTGLVLTRRAGFNGNSALSLAGQSVVAENLAFDPYSDRLSNLVEEYPSLANPVTEFLSADPTDSEAEARFKMSLEALGMEAAGVALFSAFRAYRNYSKGLEADPNDTAQIEAWIDSQAPDVDVSIAELDAKMENAVKAEAKLRETYQRASANSHILAPETIAKIKADARSEAVDQTLNGGTTARDTLTNKYASKLNTRSPESFVKALNYGTKPSIGDVAESLGIRTKFPEGGNVGSPQLVNEILQAIKVQKAPEFIETRGQGKIFHGSSADLKALDDGYAEAGSENNIYGSGFYTTDAVDIAAGYTKKGKGEAPNLYELQETRSVNLLDMEADLDAVTSKVLDDVFGDYMDVSEFTNVREALDEFRDLSAAESLSKVEVQGFFDSFRYEMEQLGYEGLSHKGGLKTNNDEHLVKIYWKPSETLNLSKSALDSYRVPKQPETPKPTTEGNTASVNPNLTERGRELYGYGVTKSNTELVRQADDVIAEVFVDSPSLISGLEQLKAAISPKDFDVYVTAAGRVLQMTSRNLAEVNQGLRTAEKELESAFKQLDARTDLTPDELVKMKGELQQNFLAHQDNYRQVRNDYIESVMAFRGAATTAGRSVQVNKLFQNFDVPPQQVEKHFDQLLRNLPNDKVRNSFVARAVFALNKKGGNIFKALDEIFISNILTGFKTHIVNTVGNSATTLYLPVERAVAAGVRVIGGDIKGGSEQFQKAMATFAGMRHSIAESSRLAVEAYKIGDTILDNKSTYEMQSRTVIGRDLPFDKKTLSELTKWITLRESEVTLMDLLGTSMRALSTRALTTEDEFFKNLNFRSYTYGNAYVDALNAAKKQGLKGAEAREQAKIAAGKAVQAASNEQMMLGKYNMPDDLGLEAYRKDSLQYAREATYTQGLSKGGASFQAAVEHIPLARQVFPFVRTPLNLISASIQRSPLAPLSGRWQADFVAGGERRALAMTRLALGTAVVTKFMSDFADAEMQFEATGQRTDVEFLGAGPTQVGARQNQQELSNAIFGSIRLPDGTQYQISRFDPFSTIFEGIGVIQDLHRNGQTEEADDLTLAYGLAIARMLGNDTYATSVRQVMYAMQDENGLDKFLQARVGQLVPLSGLTKTYNQANDPFQRELRSYTDAVKANLPGMSAQVAPRYNLLGEPVEAPKYATLGVFPEAMESMLSPIMTGKVKTDPVAVEIVNQNISTTKQSPFLKGGVINLNDERLSVNALGEPLYGDNRTAYDRFNDIMANERLFGQYTLREFLEQQITSDAYQNRLTDSIRIDTPLGKKASVAYAGSRKDILTAIISDAKEAALAMLRKENPMVNEALLLAEKAPNQAFSPRGQQQMVEDNQQFINQLNAPLEGK